MMIPRLNDPITWTGTAASTQWIVDRIDHADGGRYATAEVIEGGEGSVRLYVDTLSVHLTLGVGDTLVRDGRSWKVEGAR